MALMTRGHAATNVPINLGLAAGQEAAAEAFHPEQTPESMGPAKPGNTTTQTATPPALNTAAKVATTPPPTTDPFLQYAQPQQQGGGDLNIKLPFDRDPFLAAAAGPTFTQEGNVEPTAVGKALGLGSVGEALAAVGMTALAIAAGGHAYRRGATISAAARDTRLNDPAYAAQVNDYHNDVIKRGLGTGEMGNAVPPPPVPQGTVNKGVTYIADKLGNDAARDQRAIELMADSPSTAQKLTSELGNLHDTSLQGNQTRYFVESGHDIETGVRIPSLTNLADKLAALDPAKRETWNLGMAGASEEQVRNNNIAKWQASGGTGTPQITDIRHMYAGKDMADLQQWVADMRADPVLAALEEQYRATYRGLHEDIGANPIYGFHTPAAAAELVRMQGNMVPPFDMEGRPLGPMEMTRQNTFTGQAAGGVDPLHALTVHVEQMWNEFKRNAFNQRFVKLRENYQAQPGAPQTMTDVHAPSGPHTSYMAGGLGNPVGTPRDPIITLRTPTGVRYIREEDPHFYRILSGESLAMKRVYLGTFDVARQIYQKGTTGMMSLFTGRAQPFRSALFTPPVMAYTSGANRRGGMLDWAAQRYLPTGVARAIQPVVRGFDMPLNIAALPGFSAYTAAERMAGRFAEIFHPAATNIANQKLRAIVGDVPVDAAHQFATNWWDKSLEKLKLERGVSGHASPMRVESPGIRIGTKASILGDLPAGLRLETARVAPRAFITGRLPGTRSFGIKVHNILGQAFNDFGEAGHDMWMRLNRDAPGMDPQTLIYETRNIVGNMARSGSSSILKGASQLLPYTNVSVQGTGATIRALGARPVATPVTMAVGLGSLAALSILTMMRSGAHLDFLQNLLSTQQRAANVVLGLNDDPLKSTEIPLAQEIRAPYAFALDTTAKMINIIAARHDPNVAKAVWDGLTHFFGSNITNTSADAMRHGFIDTADFLNLPSFMGRIDWNRVIQNDYNLSGAYHSPWGGGGKAPPGGQGYDAPLDSQNGQLFEEMLSTVFGSIAHTLVGFPNSTMRYQQQGHGFLESLGLAGRDWLQTSREANPMLNNMALETQVRLSLVPPIAEALEPSIFALKNLPKAVSPGMEGYVGRGPNALPIPMTEDKSVANDMLIRQMLLVTRQYDSRINQAMLPITDLKQQMQAVGRVGMDPAKRRAWLNDRTRDLADKWKLVQGYVADLDNSLSNMAGKPIRVQDVKWGQDSSQFR